MNGLLSKSGEDLTITRKLEDGTSMTVKSPNGSSMNLQGLLDKMVEGPVTQQSSAQGYNGGGVIGGPYIGPTEDNVPISANPGEYVVNVPATEKYKPLLEQINQEGRMMLEEGGYIDQAKPMGYNIGGWISNLFKPDENSVIGQNLKPAHIRANPPGYGAGPEGQAIDATPPGFGAGPEGQAVGATPPGFGAAPTVDATPPGYGAQPTAPFQGQFNDANQPVYNLPDGSTTTNIEDLLVGNDQPVEEPEVQPEEAAEKFAAVNEVISTADETQIDNAVVNAGGDEELAKEFAEVVGPAKGVESYLANLDMQIDKQQNKRKKARLLAFGVSLLGGSSMAQAMQSANQTPFFDEEELDQMLAQRGDVMNRIGTDYLNSQGIHSSSVQDHILKAEYDRANPSASASSASGKVYENPYSFYNEAGDRKVARIRKDGTGYVDADNNIIDTNEWTLSGSFDVDEDIRKESEKALVSYDTKAAEALETARSLEDSADLTISTVSDNIEGLSDPLSRTKLGRTLARNFNLNISGSASDQAVIDKLSTELNSQSASIVGLMRSKGVTFGAMSEAEWKKIDAQVGDLEGSLGGIVAAQTNLKAAGHSIRAQMDAYADWRDDPKNRGKSLLNFQRSYHHSDAHKAAKLEALAISQRGLAEGQKINAKAKGGSEATVDGQEVDDILSKYN